MDEDRGGRLLGGGSAWLVRLGPRAGKLRRIGVEAEADLAAALVDERREPIGELLQGISRP
jgi:hypothetical protein